MTNPTTTHWTIRDFGDIVTFSGAEKLVDSNVAPLVAQARGYYTVTDADQVKNMVAEKVRTDNPAPVSKRLRAMVANDEDFMVIPWHRIDKVLADGADVKVSSIQVRPSVPLALKGAKKPPKYETLAGHPSVMDLHPGITQEWFESARTVFFTEGAIKGDSSLTAQLLAAGIDRDELAWRTDDDTTAARTRLAELLSRIEPKDRVPVISLIGVANWRQNDEWRALNLRDRKALIAFDGDLRQNFQVWHQADQLWDYLGEGNRKAHPVLIDLSGKNAEQFALGTRFEAPTEAGQKAEKMGVDDFLSHVGTWDDLLQLQENSLPPAPAKKDDLEGTPGEWRVTEDGLATVVWTESRDTGYSSWKPGIPIGGRLKSISSMLTPTDVDTREGVVGDTNQAATGDGRVVIELSWEDLVTGDPVTREVSGPLAILDALPAEWARRSGAVIHPDIRRHPSWPPRNKDAEGWLQAIKRNRVEDSTNTEGWDAMGWVPSPESARAAANGHPAFIVGTQVIGVSRDHEAEHMPGVTKDTLPGAEKYGVNDRFHEFNDRGDLEGYKKHVADAIRIAVEAFVINTPWNKREEDAAIGPMLLAGALRPANPLRPRLLFDFIGEPGSGKSWSASFMMAFWQRRGNVWSSSNLPGSAMDTFAAAENSVARTPIWVVDDLAPQASRQSAERQENDLDQLTRAIFNGSPKRRSNIDGTQRTVSIPRALTILTAENQRSNQSIRERVIEVEFSKNRIDDKLGGAIEALTKREDNPLAVVTAAMIRFWLHTAKISETTLPYMRESAGAAALNAGYTFDSWEEKWELARMMISGAREDIQTTLKDSAGIPKNLSARRAGLFSELVFSIDSLKALAEWAGIPSDDPVSKALAGDVTDPDSIEGKLVKYAAENLHGLEGRTSARTMLDAIRSMLRAGFVHYENPNTPGERPIPSDHPNANYLNRALGWTIDAGNDSWKPLGTSIGYVGLPPAAKSEKDWIALTSPQTAFQLAKRHMSDMIPAGQKVRDTWRQVWTAEQGTLVAVYGPPATDDLQIRARFDSPSRLRGVPVRLAHLIDGGVSELITEKSEI